MQKLVSSFCLTACAPLTFCLALIFSCDDSLAKDSAPILNDGKKWRIAYYQAGPIPFYSSIQKEVTKELLKKLQDGKIDLIIAMGTWAGVDLVNEFPFSLSINTATARAIDFKVPVSIQKITREMYDQ